MKSFLGEIHQLSVGAAEGLEQVQTRPPEGEPIIPHGREYWDQLVSLRSLADGGVIWKRAFELICKAMTRLLTSRASIIQYKTCVL